MRRKFHLFTLLLCTALLGCKSNEYQSDSFDYCHSVDLSHILQAYDWQQKYEGEDKTVFGKGLEDLYVPYKVACGYEDEPCADYEELLLHDAETVGVGLLGEEGGG